MRLDNMKIRLNSPSEADEFVSICDSFAEYGVDVHYGSIAVDGRSTIGVLSVMGHDIDVQIHADRTHTEEFEIEIGQFEV
jgi:hypothetical protein